MTAPIVQLIDAAAGYRGPVWRGLSVDVAAGEFLAVLGGNGVGKTTLLRVLLGQLPALSGEVRVLGAPPRRGNPRVGYVPQQCGFDPDLPVRGIDLVRLGLDGDRWGPRWPSRRVRARVDAAIEAVAATAYATEPVGRLSGGEQQRLRVAQALVCEPALLLADEPLLSLDPASQRQVSALLDARRRGADTAVVVVTHEINPLLPYTDRILYLTGGDWAAGAPEEVLTSATLSRLYGSDVEVVRVRDRVLIVGISDSPHHVDPLAGV